MKSSDGIVEIVALILGIATLSVLLSPKATTVNVIGALASGLVNSLKAATAPVTG